MSNLSFFHLFLPSSFSKKHLVVIVFFMFCPVSGLVGRLWQLNFYSNVPDISHTPSFFSHVEISHTLGLNRNEREGARSVWFGCH